MQGPVVGLFVGLLLGLAVIIEGFGAMLLVGLFGLIGYLVMKVVRGELDVNEYLGGFSSRRQ